MKTLTKKIQDSITPKDAYKLLADGNSRFVNNLQVGRDLQGQVSETRHRGPSQERGRHDMPQLQ